MAYYSAKMYYMNPVMEPPSGKGFTDVVYLPIQNADCPAKHTCVIERLKK